MQGMLAFGVVLSVVDKLTGPVQKATSAFKELRNAVAAADKANVMPDGSGFFRKDQVLARTKLAQAYGEAGRAMKQGGQQTMAWGAAVTAMGMGMRRGAEGLAAPFLEFEHALSYVKTVAPGTFGSVQADMEVLQRSARDWSQAHTDSALDFTRATYMMLSSGLDMRQSIAATSAALAVAKGTMGDAMDTAGALATFYANFGDKSRDAGREMNRLGDLMVATQQTFKFANLAQLMEGMKHATSAAKTFRVTEYQTMAALGALNDAGLEGGMAGTSYAAVLRQMEKAAGQLHFQVLRTADGQMDLIGTLKGIREQFGDQLKLPKVQQAFQQAFGDEGMKGFMSLLDKVPRMESALAALANSAGVAAKAQATMEGDGAGAFQRYQRAVEALKITVMEALAPALTSIAGVMRSVVEWLREFAAAHPIMTKVAGTAGLVVAGLFSVLGPLALVAGGIKYTFGMGAQTIGWFLKCTTKLGADGSLPSFGRVVHWVAKGPLAALRGAILRIIPVVWSFTASLLANPITWIVIAVVALVAGIVALTVYWNELVAWFQRSATWVKILVAWFLIALGPIVWLAVAANYVVRNWAAVKAWFADLWAGITAVFWGVVHGISSALTMAWNWLVDTFTGALDWLSGLPRRFFEAGAALLRSLWEGMKSIGDRVWNFVVGVFEKVGNLLPHSDAKVGPLSRLTESGRAFVGTWANGLRAAAPELGRVAEGLAGRLRLEAPELPDLALAIPGVGIGGGRGGTKEVHFHGGITVQVPAGMDAADRESFVKMLRGLAEEHG